MFSTINIFDLSEGELISILCWEKFAFLRRSTFLILYENLSGDLIFYRSNSLQHQLTGCGPKVAISCFFHFLFVIFYWSNFQQNEVGGFWARLKQLGPRPCISDRSAVVNLINLVLQNYIPRRFKIQLRLVSFQNAKKPNTDARSATNTWKSELKRKKLMHCRRTMCQLSCANFKKDPPWHI